MPAVGHFGGGIATHVASSSRQPVCLAGCVGAPQHRLHEPWPVANMSPALGALFIRVWSPLSHNTRR
jgi:hypothetical protein